MILLIFFTSAGLVSDIEILIASHEFALLLYCLSSSFNFTFTTGKKLSIGFKSELDGGHSIIFSLLCSKNSLFYAQRITYMRRSIVMYKFTHHFETARLGFVPCKNSFVHKITIVSTFQFNFFINFRWSNNGLVDNSAHIITQPPPCCLLAHLN